jgi:large subunit ribosomal protein L17
MRHRKHKSRLSRTLSHRKALLKNMAKSFFMHERIETTVEKAKELKKVVEPLITLAKEDSLTNRRRAIASLGIQFNSLTPKEARAAKAGDTSSYNDDRQLLNKLFAEFGPKFKERPGGYTRIVRTGTRVGDRASVCIIECVE